MINPSGLCLPWCFTINIGLYISVGLSIGLILGFILGLIIYCKNKKGKKSKYVSEKGNILKLKENKNDIYQNSKYNKIDTLTIIPPFVQDSRVKSEGNPFLV